MKRFNLSVFACAVLALPMLATADPIRVSYEIGDYSSGGFSASALHSANRCRSTGQSGQDLFMCGSRVKDGITGIIRGLLSDDGSLLITGGALRIDGERHRIRGGGLDPNRVFSDLFGVIGVRGYGVFLFEHLDMGSGRPNSFDGNELILWGQNEAAYECNGSRETRYCRRNSWGIDLYGTRVTVSEPETLALLGLGLLGLGLSRRRKVKAAS